MTVSSTIRRLGQETRSEARVIEIAPYAIVATDHTMTVRTWNRAAERLFGLDRVEMLGRDIQSSDFLQADVVCDVFVPTPSERETAYFECEARRVCGKRFPVEIVTAREELDGELCVVAFIRDVSAEKQNAARLRQLEEQFFQTQKLEAIGRLAFGIAHDLNNVLTAILGYVNGALTSLNQRDPAYEDIREIEYGAQRGSELTRQLLAFARREVSEPKVLDLNALVLQSAKLLSRLIGEDVRMELATLPALWQVVVDPIQFEQVLMNLVVNARDAMPMGGCLRISTDNVVLEADHAARMTLTPGPYVELTVADEGVGMDSATLARIFEPFFTTKESGKGTGLGLPTSYAIVRQAGGQIDVTSNPGEGSTFHVYLPRSKLGRTLPPSDRPKVPYPSGTETILLVEDDPQVRAVTARILRSRGYTVLLAKDGDAALTIAELHKDSLDLIVTDLVLPGVSGAEIANIIRAACPSVRALLMSGYAPEQLPNHHAAQGKAFLRKPFTPDELLLGVCTALGKA